jgi:hypothetical protein
VLAFDSLAIYHMSTINSKRASRRTFPEHPMASQAGYTPQLQHWKNQGKKIIGVRSV